VRYLVAIFGATIFACLVAVCGFWFTQTRLTRVWVNQRLSQNILLSERNLPSSNVAQTQSSTLQLNQLAEILDTTARHLRLGESFASALQAAVSSQYCAIQVLQNFSRACALGEAASEISRRLIKTAKTRDQQFVVKILELAATGGVGGVMALERAAIVIRERATHIDDRFSQAAQALLSTRILSWTPLVVAGWLVVSSSSVRHYLILSPSGWVCLLLGIGLNLAGRKWMQTIIAPKVAV
jgi:Flp pilus assembly protein TadB